jgi:exodeoxyribonuclease V alpha subunit
MIDLRTVSFEYKEEVTELEHLRCVVERITYQNAENGYSVIKCRAKGYQDLVAVVGHMPDVHVGSVLYLGGSWKMDGKYGRQFAMETFEETLPATVYGIEKYLGSGLIKGVGPKFAGRIVRQFGEDTLNVIEEDPDRLLEVPGIGKTRVERIKESWQEQKEIKNIMLFLQSHDVSTAHATRIYKTYGNDSIQVVQENPYRLADDIWGIGFKTADTIAEKMGFDHEKYERLRSGLLYTLNKLSESGHCYATRDMLMKTGAQLLAVEDNLLSITLDEMIRTEDVVTDSIPLPEDAPPLSEPETAIYLPPFYFSEAGTARRLTAVYNNKKGIRVNTEGLAERIRRRTGMEYDQVQMQAILSAASSKILVLTGGPGTGKTTTTLGIITAFREAGAKILLAAPTGRAAKRLSEASGMEAKTIHRLLEVKPPEGYQKNEGNPLEGDVLILDECSMIDVMLMYNLLKAVPDTMTLILVGDIDQLPSVGAGNVLRDIIDSGCFPVVRLTRIFRQAQESRIIMNAHRINSGKMPDISNGKKSDFFFMDMEARALKKGLNPEEGGVLAGEAAEAVTELVSRQLPAYYKVPSSDIQVLTPMQRGIAGAGNLNQILQEKLNPRAPGLGRGGSIYREGDRVMQIRNNYDKEVFNGDIGTVVSVNTEERELTVCFDERNVSYDVSELDELVLAYAATIHKSQGSEYPIVVMPVLMNHFVMLQRNLVYTGITRAKKILVLLGTRKALAYAVRNVTVMKRNTMLKERLQRENPGSTALPDAGNRAADPVSGQKKPQKILRYPEPARKTGMAAEEKTPYGSGSPSSISPPSPQEKGQGRISHAEWLKTDLFTRLAGSKFRSRFLLQEADFAYIREKGMDTIQSHAADFVRKRLSDAEPKNDGRQTPMKGAPVGHPVFLAQHATGTCCRDCLEKWHGIAKGRPLSDKEQKRIVDIIMQWIGRQMEQHAQQKY